ncbi:MAG TPA: twin-arginine translocase subunit TatC [Vicinamibacterales bacterium]
MALVPFPSAKPGDDEDPDRIDDSTGKMSFLEHLDELRTRLINIIYGLIVGCVIAYIFIQRIFDFFMRPLAQISGGHLQFTSGTEPFMLWMKIGFLAGIFISSPWILWQVWKFVAPGLYTHEKKFAIPFVVLSTVCFISGAMFCYYVAFPWTWKFFNSFSTDYMVFVPKVDEAFSLYSKMLLGFGLMFQMPTIVFFLARMGVITGGFLLKYFKYALLIITIVAAVVSPGTDAMSTIIYAVPMLALYVVSIVIAYVFQKRKRPASAAD